MSANSRHFAINAVIPQVKENAQDKARTISNHTIVNPRMKTQFQSHAAKREFPMRKTTTVQKQVKSKSKGLKVRSNNGSVTLTITTTKEVVNALDKILDTGLYGNSRGAAAERLLTEGIRDLLKEGTLVKVAKIFVAQQ